ncbi:MAG: pentapeptide repeat-containing protein [Gammaproteobacteria bacterium]|nr:pentapeptide repeat-containing protein [Gammaproteobacteria bacterium]
MNTPEIQEDEMYLLLRHGDITKFNELRKQGKECNLRNADLRSLDLREMDARGLDFTDGFLRQSDLRGVDFSETVLKGVSINSARISGTLFPIELSAEEITLSLLHGTRMRYR